MAQSKVLPQNLLLVNIPCLFYLKTYSWAVEMTTTLIIFNYCFTSAVWRYQQTLVGLDLV